MLYYKQFLHKESSEWIVFIHGAGHTVSNLYISATTGASYGLFASIDSGAVIRDLGVANFILNVSGGASIAIRGGALAGQISDISPSGNVFLTSVWSTGLIYSAPNANLTEWLVGGLIGLHYGQKVTMWKSYSSVSLNNQASGTSRIGVGGLVGGNINNQAVGWSNYADWNSSSTWLKISESYSTGSITVSNLTPNWYGIGLIIGVAYAPTELKNSFTLGTVGQVTQTASYSGLFGVDGGGRRIENAYSIYAGLPNNQYTGTNVTYAANSTPNNLRTGFSQDYWNTTATYPVLDNLPTPTIPLYGKSTITSGTYGSSGTSLGTSSISVVTYLNELSSVSSSGTALYSIRNSTGAGSYTNNVYTSGLTLSGSHSTGFSYVLTSYLPTSFTVSKKALDISGLTAANKTYDGNTTASLSGTAVLTGSSTAANDGRYIGSESVSLTGTAAGAFDTKNFGTGKTVTITGLSLTGTDAGNYTLNTYTRTADIDKRSVTLTAPSVTKAYDGLTTYTVTAGNLTSIGSTLVGGDTVTAATITYSSKNVGSGDRTVTLSDVTISDGNSGNNYTVTLAGNSSSTITRQTSVTWIGGSTGDWFNPTNWAVTGTSTPGAVPDLANVSAVVIGTGKTVTFDDSVSGRTSPASTGLVEITTLSGGGSLTVANGSISATSLNVVQLNTSSGTTITTSSGITVAPATGTTDTIAGVLAGNGTLTKNGTGTTVLTGANTYTGATTIGAGVLKLGVSSAGTTSSITSSALGTGAATVSDGAVLDVNGKTLLNALTINGSGISSGGSLINSDTNNAATISHTVALGTDSSVGGAGDITIGGIVSGSSKALTKVGAGTVTLTATNTYSGATTISAGSLVILNNAPTLNSSSYGGAGTLTIKSVASDFTSQFALASAKINSNLGGLVVGKSGNASSITTDGAISISGNLLFNGPSSLGGNITTSGTQEYTGNVTISATNVTLQTTNSSITFGGNINGATANTNSLYLLSGSGTIDLTGSVGNTNALSYFGLGGVLSETSVSGVTRDFSYTGAVQTFTATYSGTYTFYVWGAQGWSGTNAGGKGGYAYGNYTLIAGEIISIYVGGSGTGSGGGVASGGGWNGGGGGYVWSNGSNRAGGGGGATDIRIAGTALSNRVIVAGGGGGSDDNTNAIGGFGGGDSGGNGGYSKYGTGGGGDINIPGGNGGPGGDNRGGGGGAAGGGHGGGYGFGGPGGDGGGGAWGSGGRGNDFGGGVSAGATGFGSGSGSGGATGTSGGVLVEW